MQVDEKITLSKARLENAEDCLRDARLLADSDRCKALVNRTYYAVFHAMRAVLVLDEFDSKKHSGIIAEFRRNYIKTGIFDSELSAVISTLFLARSNSDYDDFYVIAKADAVQQLHDAERFVEAVKKYLDY